MIIFPEKTEREEIPFVFKVGYTIFGHSVFPPATGKLRLSKLETVSETI